MNLVTRITNKLRREYKERARYLSKVKGKQKIFCIGRNKTGTTSLKKAFKDLEYVVGNQRKAEQLLRAYKNNDFDAITAYCNTAQVFQDFPFSYPETYKYLDKAYPNSKFILTIRNDPEQWFNSVTKFHAKRFGADTIPNKNDLQNANYVWKGWMWECNRLMYKTPENDIYNKEILINSYNDYNTSVINYFKDRPDDLLILNIAKEGAYQKFCKFLNLKSDLMDFPWENKTANIK
ncbi:MAG: sulfotransferase family protein [Aequorivita sp.]